ncbi:MAG: polyphosphate kinase 2 family protein [Planctomycetales bacterium]|nr:polyphosphate kinase 2 family protein [Planctomycetales bacterium]
MTAWKLNDRPTRDPKLDKDKCKKQIEKLRARLTELQQALYAERKQSVLLVIQGLDASGKDGVVRRVFNQVSPAGVTLKAFKAPSKEELAHDFLWRVHPHVPAKGMLQVFNRSHYEDVLIQRVHRWIDEDTVKRRFDRINEFEQLLQDNNTRILKFYLHVSRDEQLKRLEERTTDRTKMWKHNPNDMVEREHWDEYRHAYEDVFKHCGPEIPWTIVPADSNWQKEYVVIKRLVETLEEMQPEYPLLAE